MPLVKKDDFTEVYVESDTEQEPKPPPAEPRPQINTERNIKGEIVSNLAKVEDEGEGAEGVEGAEGEGEGKEKKKKKKPRKKKKKASEASGFEEFYVEAPLTLDQVKESEKIYSPDRAFMERIETCIQRYKAKRKFDPFRMAVLDSYLVLGGIRAGQKQFGGGLITEHDDDNKEEIDAVDIGLQTATDYVNADMEDDDWYVDFEHVVKAFFSEKLPYMVSSTNDEQLRTACKLILNFLNYTLYHNVAPEYTDNIKAAVTICQKAEEELLQLRYFANRLPGKFNEACSTIFAGNGLDYSSVDEETLGKLKKRILDGIESKGTEEQKRLGLKAEYDRVENLGLQILEVNMPPRGTSKDTLGSLVLEPWVAEGERMPKTEIGKFEIWLEKQCLQYGFVGMKMESNVHVMKTGMMFIDTITSLNCSFYTYLEPPGGVDEFLDDDGSDEEPPPAATEKQQPPAATESQQEI